MHQPLASEIKKQASYFMIKAAFFIINFFAQDPFLEKKKSNTGLLFLSEFSGKQTHFGASFYKSNRSLTRSPQSHVKTLIISPFPRKKKIE